MPRVIIPVDNTDVTITRQIATNIVGQLQFLTKLPDADIIFNSRSEQQITQQTTEDGTLKLSSKESIIVNYLESYKEETIDPSRNSRSGVPIFSYPELGIYARPIHAKVDLELNIRLRSPSWNTLSNFLSGLRLELSRRAASNSHDLPYEYSLPEPLVGYTANVYDLTETVSPIGDTIQQFIDKHYTTGFMVRNNLSGTRKQAIVSVKNLRCLGRYTEIPKEITTEKEASVSEVAFTYTVSFDKVTHIALDYQEFIHNGRADTRHLRSFIDTLPAIPIGTEQRLAEDEFLTDSTIVRDIHYLYEDRWIPEYPLRDTTAFLIVPIQLTPADLTDVLDLNLLNDPRLPTELLNIMARYNGRVTKQFQFPVHVEFYSVGESESSKIITCDGSLNISTNIPLDLRERHYLRFSLIEPIHLVSLCFMLDNYVDLLYLLRLYDPTINTADSTNTLETAGGGAVATTASLNSVIRSFKTTPDHYVGCNGSAFMYTTNKLNVIVSK